MNDNTNDPFKERLGRIIKFFQELNKKAHDSREEESIYDSPLFEYRKEKSAKEDAERDREKRKLEYEIVLKQKEYIDSKVEQQKEEFSIVRRWAFICSAVFLGILSITLIVFLCLLLDTKRTFDQIDCIFFAILISAITIILTSVLKATNARQNDETQLPGILQAMSDFFRKQ